MINKMSRLEIIANGKKVQELATFHGLHCPAFSTAFGLRIAVKLIHIVQKGPKTDDLITFTNEDLKTLHLLTEGDRATMYDKLINQLEKMTNMVRNKKTDWFDELKKMAELLPYRKDEYKPDDIQVLTPADIETMKHSESTILDAKRMDPLKIK